MGTDPLHPRRPDGLGAKPVRSLETAHSDDANRGAPDRTPARGTPEVQEPHRPGLKERIRGY
jgi:hypothetical protein